MILSWFYAPGSQYSAVSNNLKNLCNNIFGDNVCSLGCNMSHVHFYNIKNIIIIIYLKWTGEIGKK